MNNTPKIPFMEDFKQQAKLLKLEKQLISLGHAQNSLARKYGYKDYNAIKPDLIEKDSKLNRLPKKMKQYRLSNGSIVINSGLWKTKDAYMTSGYHSHNSYINKSEIEKALLYIDEMLEKRKTVNRRGGTSYGLKHRAEEYIKHYNLFDNPYISNGAFIVALDLRGFTIREIYDDYEYSLNIQTNYKKMPSDFR